MSKYIDAEATIKGLQSALPHAEDTDEAERLIRSMPAADVAEIKRSGAELFIDYPDYEGVKTITLGHDGYGCSFVEENTDRELHYGRWIKREYCSNYSGYDYGMRCSVCGKPLYRQFAEKMPPFCPNCGASMDEVTE